MKANKLFGIIGTIDEHNAKALLVHSAIQHIRDMTPMLSLGIDVFDTNERILIRAY